MDLDRPLGEWHQVKRNTWWPCYATEGGLIYRCDKTNALTMHKRDPSSLIYCNAGKVTSVPIASYPIGVQRIGEKVWTAKRYRPVTTEEQEPVQPGCKVYDTLNAKHYEKLINGSDGSVRFETQVAAAAWIISAGPEGYVKACFLMSWVNKVTSYRSELEGVYRGLKHMQFKGVTADKVVHWLDNKSGVGVVESPPTGPVAMVQPDADLILAIKKEKEEMTGQLQCRHVKGHQDANPGPMSNVPRDGMDSETTLDSNSDSNSNSNNSDKEDGIETLLGGPNQARGNRLKTSQRGMRLREAKINLARDKLASETTEIAEGPHSVPPGPVLEPPYPGLKIMLKIRKTWIMSGIKRELYKAHRDKAMRKYCRQKYGWTRKIYNLVDKITFVAQVPCYCAPCNRVEQRCVFASFLPF